MSEPITNAADAVAALGALPVPVGPEPRPLSDERLEEIRNRRLDEVTPGPWLVANDQDGRAVVYAEWPAADGRAGANVLLVADAASEADVQFVASARQSVPELATEVDRLRAQVAALLVERHVTNEALDDAVQALRAVKTLGATYPPALPWAALLDDEDLDEFLADLTASIVGHDGAAALAEIERTCGTWRLIAEAQHGHNTAPGPDAARQSFAERASRETDPGRRAAWRMLAQDVPDGEHWAAVHHDYRTPHDLPETGGEHRG